MITHDQAHDLLAAFALDAVDGGIEHGQIESHLNECPRCATELIALRDVASALGNCVEPVPERLWSVISSRLSVSEQEEPAPPLLKVLPSRTGRTEKASRFSAETPRSRTGRRYLIVVTSVAAAAAAVAAVLGFSLVRTSDQNDRLQAQIGSNSSSVVAALETPGHTLVSLRAPNHAKLAQFVLLPSGRGYLVSSRCQSWRLTTHTSSGHHRGASDLARPVGSGSEPGSLHGRRGLGCPESTGCDGGARRWFSPPHHNDGGVESNLG